MLWKKLKKFEGVGHVRWIYIQDVPNFYLKAVQDEHERTSIAALRDGHMVPSQEVHIYYSTLVSRIID